MDNQCSICRNVFCTSYSQLWEHVLGNKHKRRVMESNPDMAASLKSLQYFLDTRMKHVPILGLQYIVEYQEHRYKYTCNLCDIKFDNKFAVDHVSGLRHMQRYLERHHPKQVADLHKAAKRAGGSSLWRETALKIHRKHGRKVIQEIRQDAEDPPPVKKPAKPNSKRKRKYFKKKCRMKKEANALKGLIQWRETVQFQSNDDFMDYVRDFEIHNDGDAALLKDLTHSCTAALMAFWDEELSAELTQVSPSSVHAGADTDTDLSCQGGERHGLQSPNEIDSESQCSFSRDNDASESDHRGDATEIFFSNIKDMEVSEVIAVFEKIAATNSAFTGINIPSTIKYLQETGRLKKS